ncbi:PBECR4 domain-containing protein [Lysinibacillus fusiformis]|uniref:PBECR4 domain-containing protein n=1 Tax=Lysinibacillus fusiformis TaxID=28031 RepID=UPI0011A2D50B|nr:PBECR4 domain-containing protein [Lysinibacillus fusiformis]
MQFTKKQIINKITQSFRSYQNLEDKTYMYVFYNNKNKKYEEVQVFYGKENFMHLTGIDYKEPKSKKMSSTDFYSLLESGEPLVESNIITKNETQLKMEVISHISELDKCGPLKVINEQLHMLKSNSNGALRSKKMIFALGFQQIGLKKIPKTLLNLRTVGKIQPGHPVLCIYKPSDPNKSKPHHIICKSLGFDNLFKNSPYPFK